MEALDIVRKMQTSGLAARVDDALSAAVLVPEIDSNVGIYSIDGMSGKRYRYFINRLIGSMSDDARYLEVGSWAGSTLCSAIHGNRVWAVAIDNWSEFGGPKELFMHNVQRFITSEAQVTFLESDFRKVDYRQMQRGFNVYLFDGPHAEQDQYDGLAMALPCVDRQFVFIVDDWNWDRVRAGTLSAIKACGLRIVYSSEIRTSLDNSQPEPYVGKHSNWHNGYFISVLEKPAA